MSPSNRHRTLILLLLAAAAGTSHAAGLYRWVDSKGNVHYSDRVPPEYVKEGYRVINQQGLTVTTIAPQKDEIASKKQAAEVKAQAERDRRLLITYSSADEIIAARDRKIAEIKTTIAQRQQSLALLERQFRSQTSEAGDYERRGEAIPEDLRNAINANKKKIGAHEEAVKQLQQQQLDTQKQFAEELAEYNEISQRLDIQNPKR